jgi:hypothetical protein
MRLVASCLKCEASVDAIGKRAVVEDRLSGLMNHILQRILSFLPLRDFVQMCMLAHRYRKQWKFILAIHTTTHDAKRNRIQKLVCELSDDLPQQIVAESSIPLKRVMSSKRQCYIYNYECDDTV